MKWRAHAMVFSLALSVLGVLMGAANLQHPRF